MLKLDGMCAIITDGGRGIGRATALALAADGCNAVVCSRTVPELNETAAAVQKLGVRGVQCMPVEADVTEKKDILRVVSRAMRRFKRVDILMNNAGIALMKPLESTTEKEWNRVIRTNLSGTFLFTHAVLSHMIEQESGVIVNVSPMVGRHGIPGMAAYSASKFGVIGFTESLAEEVADDGVRVYAVCPRSVDTKMYHSLGLPDKPELKPEDIARKIAYLVSPGCKVPTGNVIDF